MRSHGSTTWNWFPATTRRGTWDVRSGIRHYAHLAEVTKDGKPGDVINVTHPETYPLLRDLYGDLCAAFPSRVHYMAGDEAFALGLGASKEAANDVGTADLYLMHLKFVRGILRERGKRMAVAGDPFEPGFFKAFGLENYGLDALARVPRDVIIGPWHYGRLEEYPFGDQLEAMGFDQYLWTPDARDWDRLLRVAVESYYGTGTAELADVMRFLSDTERHFGWGRAGLPGPEFPLFFGPLKPRRLDEAKLDLLDAFRRRRLEMCAVHEDARGRASRNVPHLDYLGFALDQHAVLADLVECRHLLAGAGKGDAATADPSRLREVLTTLAVSLPDLTRRYSELWLRMDRPLGLDPNRKRFERLSTEVEAALLAE